MTQTSTLLIPFTQHTIGAVSIPTVDARDLYDFLAPKSRFNDWITRRIQQYGFTEDRDFTVLKSEYGTVGSQAEYFLTLGMAKELSMVEKTRKGKEARQYFLACEEQLKTHQTTPHLPRVQYPELQAIIDLVMTVNEVRLKADAATQRAEVAEAKADLALAEIRTMTLEDFVMANGLMRQLPQHHWQSYAQWLKAFCQSHGLAIRKDPVPGRPWQNENVYPITALGALLRHEQTRPWQVALVRPQESRP